MWTVHLHKKNRGTDTYTGENLAILTRIDPSQDIIRTSVVNTYPRNDSTCPGIWGDDTQSVSKNFIANFTIENFGDVTLMGIHFLAQPSNSARCGPREAQAWTVSTIVKQYTEIYGRDFIVLGDC